MPNYTGINHVALATPDMPATIRFWRDLIGLRLIVGLGKSGFRHYFFEISKHDMIAFFEWPEVETITEKDHGVPVNGPFAFDHMSIEVQSLDDLWEIYDKLNAADFWVSEILDHGFIYSLYSFDPNNIPIEFSAPNEKFNVRKYPRITDSSPCPEALEGTEAQSGIWPEVTNPTPSKEQHVFPGEGVISLSGDP
ncbi:MAG TPA: VOC family protein [Desulfohalobiaceae bacterium]|nr:VOC family protein [Desulfohalobiaceae bacterium]